MPDNCCAIGCYNVRRKGNQDIAFYRIPNAKKNPKRRHLWISAIRRGKWSTLPRKSPKKRIFQEDEFKRNNNIICLESINELF